MQRFPVRPPPPSQLFLFVLNLLCAGTAVSFLGWIEGRWEWSLLSLFALLVVLSMGGDWWQRRQLRADSFDTLRR